MFPRHGLASGWVDRDEDFSSLVGRQRLARKDFVRRKAPAVEAFARLAGSRDPILQGKLFGSAFQSGFFG